MRELGYEITPGRSGAPEIKGYSQEYLDASSQHQNQILAHMQQNGLSGYEAAEIAAHATRDKKQIQSPGEVLAAHRKLAAEFGNQPNQVVASARERSQKKSAERAPEKTQKAAQEAVTFARERNFEREAVTDGDRLQFTAPNRELGVANRDLATVQKIDENGKMTVHMDGGKDMAVTFDPAEMRHFEHGYAVTSHSSQGLTSERVLVNMDTTVHPELINTRFAYVSVSRASHDAQIFTNDAAKLVESLGRDVSKASALDLGKVDKVIANLGLEKSAVMKTTPNASLTLGL